MQQDGAATKRATAFIGQRDKLSKAYIDGFKWALNKPYTFIVEMDADFSHNPHDIPRLVNSCLKNNGVSVGSRYVDNKINVVNWDF